MFDQPPFAVLTVCAVCMLTVASVGSRCLPDSGTVDDLAQGLVFDRAPHAMTALAKPGHLQAVVDPQFHTVLRRISDVEAAASGNNAIIKPMYSTMPAWNADESLLILWQRGVGHNLYDGRTYRFLRTLDIRPRDLEHVAWHATDPHVLFYPQAFKLGSFYRDFIRYHVVSGQRDTLRSFTDIVKTGYGFSFGSDPGYSCWESRIFGFADTENGLTFAYDLQRNQVGAIRHGNSSRAAAPAPSGKLFYCEGEVVDFNMQTVRTLDLFDPTEHAALGRLANGHDAYFTVAYTAGEHSGVGSLVAHDLTAGSHRVIVGPATGYPYPPSGTYISALIFRHPGWVVVSIVGFAADGSEVLDNEILLINTAPGGKVCRVAHHRSRGRLGPMGYWAEPHAVPSPSGTRILFGSDWEGGSSVDTYVVELPSYRPDSSAVRAGVTTPAVTTPALLMALSQSFPNPFNPTTTIAYSLSRPADVAMTIIDPLGRAVRTLVQARRPAGQFREVWDGCDEQGRPVASGVYICRLQCERSIMQRKLIRLR